MRAARIRPQISFNETLSWGITLACFRGQKLQPMPADGAAPHRRQTGIGEHRFEVVEGHVPMAMKVRQESSFSLRLRKVDDQQTPALL